MTANIQDLPAIVAGCHDVDSNTLGEYCEHNWERIAGNTKAMAYLTREMKRRFQLRSRKRKPDGSYETIRGFTSFEKWFVRATGKSVRMAYYAVKDEDKKHKTKKTSFQFDSDYVRACVDKIKKTLQPLEPKRRLEIVSAVATEIMK